MGLYLNPGNESFRQSVTDEIYIDKTAMISLINKKLNKSRTKYVCVSRPRRFGKSMAADMLAAYYGKGCDSRELFEGKKSLSLRCWEMAAARSTRGSFKTT